MYIVYLWVINMQTNVFHAIVVDYYNDYRPDVFEFKFLFYVQIA